MFSHIYLRLLFPVHYATMFVKDIQDFKDQDLSFEFLSGIPEDDCRPQNTGLTRQKNTLQQFELPSGFDRTQCSVFMVCLITWSFQVAVVLPHRLGRSASYVMAAASRAPLTQLKTPTHKPASGTLMQAISLFFSQPMGINYLLPSVQFCVNCIACKPF